MHGHLKILWHVLEQEESVVLRILKADIFARYGQNIIARDVRIGGENIRRRI